MGIGDNTCDVKDA